MTKEQIKKAQEIYLKVTSNEMRLMTENRYLQALKEFMEWQLKNLHKNHTNDNELNTEKNILTEQSNYSINACLKELQFNRPADVQRHIDKLISISTIIA